MSVKEKKTVYRLDRLLAASGFGSRKEVKTLLREERIELDGQILSSPDIKLDLESAARVHIDGKLSPLQIQAALMMNKAKGRITAMEDSHELTVADDLPPEWRSRKLMPVGRLDKDTTGLLLFTSDGILNHRLASPKYDIEKRYTFRYEGPLLNEAAVSACADGIVLEDGPCKPACLFLQEGKRAELIISEGRFHQIKRMLEALGRRVTELERLSLGPLELDADLTPGSCRLLNESEKQALYNAAGLKYPEEI